MNVRKIMTAPAVTVKANSSVLALARLLSEKHVSGAPVVDDSGALVGIVTEQDLLRRHEIATEKERPWWLRMLVGESVLADEYVKAHAKQISDIMTRNVVTVSPTDSIRHLVDVMEKHSIKRVPVIENNQVIGVVSRSDLVRMFAESHGALTAPMDDHLIRKKLITHLQNQPWAHMQLVNVNVSNGVVELSGLVRTDTEANAIRVAAQSMLGVKQVIDRLARQPAIAES
jgi:CBS domain-containing protein